MSESARRSKALILFILLALLAVADGVWLTLIHIDYEVGREGFQSVCHRFSDGGCGVTAGRYGALFGIPVATIGFAGALTMLVTAVMAWLRRADWDDAARSVLVVLSAGAVVASAVMAALSLAEGSFCPFCVVWYGLNLGLLLAAWVARTRDRDWRDLVDDALGGAGFVALAIFSLALVAGTLLHHGRRAELEQERDQTLEEHADLIAAGIVAEIVETPPQSFQVADAPRKGAENPEVTIVEFGDFECPHCRKLWASVEMLYSKSSERLQVSFAHYPLDSSCNRHIGDQVHPHACQAAVAGECARRQDKFWDYGEQMFLNQEALERADLVRYAGESGLDASAFEQCLDDPSAMAKVKADIELGTRLDIRATPTFFVNGYTVTGALPPPLLRAVVDALVKHDAG